MACGFSVTSTPSTRTVPEVGSSKLASTRKVVVLPAPLSPRKPTTSPLAMVKLRSRMAARSPKYLESWFASIMAGE